MILIPGNHEWLDEFKFLNTRFQYPGTVRQEENNLFRFSIGKTFFISNNFDYFQSNEAQQMETLRKFLEEGKGFEYKVLLNHRGLLCLRDA